MAVPSLYPYLFYSRRPGLGAQPVLDKSVEDYYGWKNLKKRMAFNIAASGMNASDSSSPGTALGAGIVAYAALTVGEKITRVYKRLLGKYTDSHPGFEEFRNAHPIIGNAVAWLPGVGAAAVGTAGTALLGAYGLKAPAAMRLLKHPAFRIITPVVILGGLVATSFWGILAKNGLKTASRNGTEYRALRKENPDLTPKQLKQLSRALRNQQYAAQYQGEEQRRRQADLDPQYGVAPYQSVSLDSFMRAANVARPTSPAPSAFVG